MPLIYLSGFFAFLKTAIFTLGYISNNSLFPEPLSAEEENEYLEKYMNGDEDARNILIERNLRLVVYIAKKFENTGVAQEDLVSIGTIGLIKAVDSYNITHKTRFATYAAKCIQNEILMHFRSQRKLQNEVSINEAIDTDRDGNPLTYEDIISTDENMAEDLDRRILAERAHSYIGTLLSTRERQVIYLRYGLSGKKPKTQKETSAILGISRSYVSRIEKSALDKLREALGSE